MIKKSLLVCGVFVFNVTFGADNLKDSGSDTAAPSSPTRAQYDGAVGMVKALLGQDGKLSSSRQSQLDNARVVVAGYEEAYGKPGREESPKAKKRK